jgi:hypothetical protein
MQSRGTLVAAALIGVLLAGTPARADIVKCQAGIEKNGSKLAASIWKTLGKCKDGYQKAVAKAEALNVKAGPGCNAGLGKVADMSLATGALAKTKAALDTLVTIGTCTNEDLLRLGHLPAGIFGDLWSKWVCLAAIKSAYEQQVSLVGLTPQIFIELNANGCPLCARFARPPCARASCELGGSTGAKTSIVLLNEPPNAPQNVPISGELITDGCTFPGLTTNETATVGGPSIGLNPTSVLGTNVCTNTIRSEGFTSCSGGSAMPNVSYVSCQDSDTTDGDECATFLGGSPLCLGSPGTNTGGVCTNFTTSAATTGSSFALATTQLLLPTAAGGDGVFCTADDTVVVTAPTTIPITTGSATTNLLDANDTNGNTKTIGPITGNPGPSCAQNQAGNLSGLKLVGAFPAADTVGTALEDTLSTTTLECP